MNDSFNKKEQRLITLQEACDLALNDFKEYQRRWKEYIENESKSFED